jgi:hypothetical protein
VRRVVSDDNVHHVTVLRPSGYASDLGCLCAAQRVDAVVPTPKRNCARQVNEAGRLLLVPLYSGTIDERHLIKAGLTRVGPGPIPGSLVVQGLGLQLASGLLEKGVLMLAAPASLCSELKRD